MTFLNKLSDARRRWTFGLSTPYCTATKRLVQTVEKRTESQ